jgi:hypothetical protein
MKTRHLIHAVALVAALALLGNAQSAEGSWTGFITDTHCGAQKDFAKHANCAKKCVGGGLATWAFYNPADKKVYKLDPSDKAAGLAGKQVKVTGTIAGDTVKVASIEEVKPK